MLKGLFLLKFLTKAIFKEEYRLGFKETNFSIKKVNFIMLKL